MRKTRPTEAPEPSEPQGAPPSSGEAERPGRARRLVEERTSTRAGPGARGTVPARCAARAASRGPGLAQALGDRRYPPPGAPRGRPLGAEAGVPESRARPGDGCLGLAGTSPVSPPRAGTQGWPRPAAPSGWPGRGGGEGGRGGARAGRVAGGAGRGGGGAAAGGGRVRSPAQGPQGQRRSQAASRERPGADGLTGRRGRAEQVQTLPGTPPAPAPSLPGPVRPPARRARAAPAPCAPVAPWPRPRPQLLPPRKIFQPLGSNSWGGGSDPVELCLCHPGGESAKIPNKSHSKVGKHTPDLPARAGASCPSPRMRAPPPSSLLELGARGVERDTGGCP